MLMATESLVFDGEIFALFVPTFKFITAGEDLARPQLLAKLGVGLDGPPPFCISFGFCC